MRSHRALFTDYEGNRCGDRGRYAGDWHLQWVPDFVRGWFTSWGLDSKSTPSFYLSTGLVAN
jgi:hypothetical protein